MSDRPRWKDIEEDREEQCVDTCPLTSPDHFIVHSFYALIDGFERSFCEPTATSICDLSSRKNRVVEKKKKRKFEK